MGGGLNGEHGCKTQLVLCTSLEFLERLFSYPHKSGDPVHPPRLFSGLVDGL